jgi:hypothetical protein
MALLVVVLAHDCALRALLLLSAPCGLMLLLAALQLSTRIAQLVLGFKHIK